MTWHIGKKYKQPGGTIFLVDTPSCFPLGKVYLNWLWNRKQRNRKQPPLMWSQNHKTVENWNSFLCSSALTCAGRKTWASLKTMLGKYPNEQRTNSASTIIDWNLKSKKLLNTLQNYGRLKTLFIFFCLDQLFVREVVVVRDSKFFYVFVVTIFCSKNIQICYETCHIII